MTQVSFIGADAIIARARTAALKACTSATEHLVGDQQAAAPVRTGALRAGIHVESITMGGNIAWGETATGGESNAYAVFVHEGTAPHIIHGNPWLFWPGADHPVQEVHHPGTHADRFMSDPLLANVALYERAGAAAMAEAF